MRTSSRVIVALLIRSLNLSTTAALRGKSVKGGSSVGSRLLSSTLVRFASSRSKALT